MSLRNLLTVAAIISFAFGVGFVLIQPRAVCPVHQGTDACVGLARR